MNANLLFGVGDLNSGRVTGKSLQGCPHLAHHEVAARKNQGRCPGFYC